MTSVNAGVRWLLVVAATAMGTLLFGATAWASSPGEVVEQRTEAVADVLAQPESAQRTEQLAETIDESLDFAYLAARALGEHWQQRSDEERREFMELLRRLLQHNYEDRLAGHVLDDDYTVEHSEPRVRDDRAFVESEFHYDDQEEVVMFRLHRDDGTWKVYDVVIDDITLEETYREGYVPIIENEGWEALIERMEQRLEKLERK